MDSGKQHPASGPRRWAPCTAVVLAAALSAWAAPQAVASITPDSGPEFSGGQHPSSDSAGSSPVAPGSPHRIEVESPAVLLRNVPFLITVAAPESLETLQVRLTDAAGVVIAEGEIPPVGTTRLGPITLSDSHRLPLVVTGGGAEHEVDRPLFPGWVSILPPLLAILLALLVREVIASLFVGIWLGAFFLAGYNPFSAILLTVERFARPALADPDHAAIVIFSMLLGGMVGILTRMGATRAIVTALEPVAVNRRRAQLATWLAGLAICFDDYANTLIVGNTMRPLTDRLRISREKLAYIVDSTAAPVAAIFFVSTWVGFEISLIGDGLRLAAAQHPGDASLAHELLVEASPFAVFLHSIPYLFYPLLAIFTVGLVVLTGRDIGPMLAAERRAATGGGLLAPGAQPVADVDREMEEAPGAERARWWHAAIPVLTVIGTVVGGLLVTGAQAIPDDQPATLSALVGAADPFRSLLWGSLLGCLVAAGLAMGARVLTLSEASRAWMGGLKAMLLAVVILVLAWSLGEVTNTLGTAPYIATILTDRLPAHFLPVAVFLTAAAVSFATGTSWGTMAILFPIVIPLAVAMGGAADFDGGTHYSILLGTISSVMAGSVFGDHCSPISDTTVMSSMASGCDHVDHVRTQLPYAILVAVVGMAVGDIPTAYGFPPWASLLLGAAIILLILRFVGRRDEEVHGPDETRAAAG